MGRYVDHTRLREAQNAVPLVLPISKRTGWTIYYRKVDEPSRGLPRPYFPATELPL